MSYKQNVNNVVNQYVSTSKVDNPYFSEKLQYASKLIKGELRKKVDGGFWTWNSRLNEFDKLSNGLKDSNLSQNELNTWKELKDTLLDNKYLVKKASKDVSVGGNLKNVSLSIDDYVNNYSPKKEIKEPRRGFLSSLSGSKLARGAAVVLTAATIFYGVAHSYFNRGSRAIAAEKEEVGEAYERPNIFLSPFFSGRRAFYDAFEREDYMKKADGLLALTEKNIGKMSGDQLDVDYGSIESFLKEADIDNLTKLARGSQTDVDDIRMGYFKQKYDKLGNYANELKTEKDARKVSAEALKKAQKEFELEKEANSDINSLKNYFGGFNKNYDDLENKVNSTKTNKDNDVLSQLVADVDNLSKERYSPVLSDIYSLGVFNSLVNRNTNEAARSLEYLVGVDDMSNVVIPTELKKDWKRFNRKIIAHCNEQDPYWDWDNLNEITKFLKRAKDISPDDYRNIRALALKHAVDELEGYKPKSFWGKVVHELMLWQNLWEGPEGIGHMFIPAKYKDNSNDIVAGNGRLTSGDNSNWLQDGLFAAKEFAELYLVYQGIASLASSGGNGGGVVTPTGGGGEGPGGSGGS